LNEEGHPRPVVDIALSADGVYLAVRYLDSVWVWDWNALAAGASWDEPLLVLEASKSWMNTYFFPGNRFMTFDGSGDQTVLAYADFNVLRLVDVTTGQEIAALDHEQPIIDMSYAPDARLIALRTSIDGSTPDELGYVPDVSESGQIVVWQLGENTGQIEPEQVQAVDIYEGHQIALSPGGELVILTDIRDGEIAFYDTRQITDFRDYVHWIEVPVKGHPAFSPDGTRLVFEQEPGRKIAVWGVW
ncbi:MAG: hypothetical protein JXQ72_16910, partial [Anaerolineae bacterium]|nr:hypothetical protein [Anaerolineae bacterium]